jgi:hypothetical protein
LISFYQNKDAVRVIRNAVLDDVSPPPRGTCFEYWRGDMDVDPKGLRKAVFEEVRRLYQAGHVVPYQVRDGGEYSYRFSVL